MKKSVMGASEYRRPLRESQSVTAEAIKILLSRYDQLLKAHEMTTRAAGDLGRQLSMFDERYLEGLPERLGSLLETFVENLGEALRYRQKAGAVLSSMADYADDIEDERRGLE